MFERLLNAKIVALQSQLVRKYGDCVEVSQIIRDLDKQARATKNLACFDSYKV